MVLYSREEDTCIDFEMIVKEQERKYKKNIAQEFSNTTCVVIHRETIVIHSDCCVDFLLFT